MYVHLSARLYDLVPVDCETDYAIDNVLQYIILSWCNHLLSTVGKIFNMVPVLVDSQTHFSDFISTHLPGGLLCIMYIMIN